MDTIASNAKIGAGLTGLPEKLVAAWWIAENGWAWPETNNPANISFTGQGIPSYGVFAGTVEVLPNHVCKYATAEDGIRAWAEEINAPVGQKFLDVDTAQL